MSDLTSMAEVTRQQITAMEAHTAALNKLAAATEANTVSRDNETRALNEHTDQLRGFNGTAETLLRLADELCELRKTIAPERGPGLANQIAAELAKLEGPIAAFGGAATRVQEGAHAIGAAASQISEAAARIGAAGRGGY